MKLLFITNVPAPYRVDFFNELVRYCDLTVCYERRNSLERNAEWKNEKKRRYKEVFCEAKTVKTDQSLGLDLIRKTRETQFDHLFISGYSSPSVVLLILYCRLKKIPYFIETDGGFAKKDKFILRQIKRFLLGGAKGVFTTCTELAEYYRTIGYKGFIFKYPLSSISKSEICHIPADEREKKVLRQELCMKEEQIVITVGRFSYKNGYGKGYDRVLTAAKLLQDKNIGWYIIGGTPTDEFVLMKKEMLLDNLHYIDFKKKDELKKYYRAADLFVLMTVGDVWGLVVNEAMAYGLPVITTDKCIAGIEMIEDGKNGFIIPVGDGAQLAYKVDYLLKNNSIRQNFAQSSIEKVKDWTIENMVQKHIEVLQSM